MGGRRGRSDPNSGTTTVEQWNSGTATEPTEQEEKIINLLNDRNDISGIKPSDRSVDQQKKLRSLQYQLKKLDKEVDMVLDKFPDLKRKKQMTIAERKKTSRNEMTQDHREEARRADREQRASHRANQTQEEREEERRQNREQMEIHRRNLTQEEREEERRADREQRDSHRRNLTQ